MSETTESTKSLFAVADSFAGTANVDQQFPARLHLNKHDSPVSGPSISVSKVISNGAANCHARLLVPLCHAAFDAA